VAINSNGAGYEREECDEGREAYLFEREEKICWGGKERQGRLLKRIIARKI